MPAKKTQLSKSFVSPDWGDVQAAIFFHSLCVSSFFSLSRCFFQQHPKRSWAHGSPVVRFYQWVNSTEVGQINTSILWETGCSRSLVNVDMCVCTSAFRSRSMGWQGLRFVLTQRSDVRRALHDCLKVSVCRLVCLLHTFFLSAYFSLCTLLAQQSLQLVIVFIVRFPLCTLIIIKDFIYSALQNNGERL